ncbi:hypothetical protein NQK81_02155 [Amycolatopsis roodepoortensis]|uniref:hypothetical protein n=1 Tax=Amycolatopsis roodepoortensis TaxID=700274 RepID=UPI00214CA179|nr:hypothetical protein [Amycolatopsis roodepoortensis]UUV32277.1 hypothetical protein NQK81_02155 [Amycolatopsis roodepoortensis]
MTSSAVPSWPAALAAAEAMTAWHQRGAQDPDAKFPVETTRLLALALWRVAAEHRVAVSEAVLGGPVFGYLRCPERLLAEPSPPDAPAFPAVDELKSVLSHADWVMSTNFMQHSVGRDLGNTDDGRPDFPTVGERLDEIVQDPGGQPPLPEAATVRDHAGVVGPALTYREWLPTDTEREIAKTALLALRSSPVEPTTFDRSWLARLRRLALAGKVLRGLAGLHRPNSSPLLIDLLTATADLFEVVTEPVASLESAWSARPVQQRLPSWERLHVPLGTRARVVDTEHIAAWDVGSTLMAVCTGDVDH